jgi:hypothetical protein
MTKNPIFQTNRLGHLKIGAWKLFGAWDLKFGI